VGRRVVCGSAAARLVSGERLVRAALAVVVAALPGARGLAAESPVHRLRATLTVEQASGPECPPASRYAPVALVVTQSDTAPRLTGALFVGDEFVKTVEGDRHDALQLRDGLVANETPAANTLALDRWPDPTSGRIAFQVLRLRCRITAARLAFDPAPAPPDPRLDAYRTIVADVQGLARIHAAGSVGDPRLGAATIDAIHERLHQALGEGHMVTIEARFLQMLIAQDTDALSRAIEIGARLREVFSERFGADSRQTARLRVSLAYTLWRVGRSADAIAETQAALVSIAASSGRSDRFYITVLRTLGEYQMRSSRYVEAIASTAEAERLARDALGEDTADRFDAAAALFRAQHAAGRPEVSREMLFTVLPMARRKVGIEHPSYVRLVEVLANWAQELRLHEEAEGATEFVLRQRERALGPANPATLTALVNVAEGRARQGRLDEAERLYLEAYGRLPQEGARHEQLATIELSLSQLYLGRGDLVQARRFIDLAAERTLAYYGQADPRTLKSVAARAEWLRRTGEPRQALALLAAVRERLAALDGAAPFDEMYTLSQMAQAHQALGETEPAAARLEDLVGLAEAQRDGVRADAASRRALLSNWVSEYKRLAAIRIAQGRFDDAFALAELSKGRTLLDQVSEQSARSAGGLSDAQRADLQDQAAHIIGLEERLAAAAAGSTEAVDLAAELLQRRARYRQTKEALAATHRRYAELTRLHFVDLPSAGRLLRDEELAVSYLVTADTLLAFIVNPAGSGATTVPLTQSDRASLEAFARLAGRAPSEVGAQLWQKPDGTRSWSFVRPDPDAIAVGLPQLARDLARLLLDPLRPHLRGKRRILVAPDGPLAALPFELLTLAGEPLVNTYEVHYVQSLSVYARMRQAAPSTESRTARVLAIGAPTFGEAAASDAGSELPADRAARYRSAGLTWQPLPEARLEIESIARTFPGSRVLVGEDASEERLLELDASGELARYRYLHFATHAFFSSARPELSAIVLRQPGSERADGFLTVSELPRYRLGTELTVLSACETAAGRIVDGEGVMGFAYALLVAGNRSTVAALWKVPDDATRAFMELFFGALRRGNSHVAALAQAKRAMQRQPRLAAPANWAGFVLYGR
jgi:CHAT domain-containing protein